MRCSKCDAENPEGKKFCADCGAALGTRCPACGADSPVGKRFCGNCGAKLPLDGGGAEPPAAPRSSGGTQVPVAPTTASVASEGERRHLTVLYCDLVNSTEISSHLDLEDWREFAASYQRGAADAVTRFGGHVAKHLGDALMVYFGWPEAHEDDAERAVRAGLAIIEEVAALSGRLAREHQLRLAVRVGIETGAVLMGHVSGAEASVFGDAPSVASRVQSAAEPDSVLITAAVHELVSGRFVLEDRGVQQLKDVKHSLHLYRVIRPAIARRRTHGAAVRALTPFVGRAEEMRLLVNRWERAREGEGQLVLVTGEPGIGKSRLVEEFRARIADHPHLWIECAGEQLFQGTPFHAVTQILTQGLGWRGDESPEERFAQLEKLAGLKPEEAVPLIAELLNLSVPDKYPPLALDPDQRRRRLIVNLTAWVLNTARRQPVVIAMEDLHWVDPSTLELTQTLVEQAATAPLMLLYTARPEFHPPWPLRAYHARITLSRLNDRHTREMVTGVVARAALAQDLIDAVVKRTDGVPLFAEELTRLILEGHARSVAHEIPATLRDSLAARLDRLGPAKEVAQIASVIGRDFSYELLQAVAAIPEGELQAALEKLADTELIYARGIAPEASYQFKHALIQDTAYEALLKTRRKELHRRVAEEMTTKFAAQAEEHPEVIARHWDQAGETERAIAAWRKAADAVFERRAFKEAENAYRQALAILRTLPESAERDGREWVLMNRFAQVLQVTQGWAAAEAAAAAERACALAEKSGDLAQLVLQMTGSFATAITKGDLPAASAVADRILELAERDGSAAVLGSAHACQVTACYCRGDLSGAEKHFRSGAPMFEVSAREVPSVLGSFGVAGHVAWMLGNADLARDRMRRAIEGAVALKSTFELAYAQYLAAALQLFMREFGDAKTSASTAVALADEHGYRQYGSGARIFLGLAEAALGNPAEGMPKVEAGLRDLTETGTGIMMTLYLSWIGVSQWLDGKVPEALATIEKALQVNPAELSWRPDTIRLRGELHWRLGHTQQAERDFREAIAVAQKIGAKAWELRAAMSLAKTLRKRGEIIQARELLAVLYSGFTEGFDTPDLKDAKSLLTELN
jgi:class 3 adenylate cyclase/tetratricopeptide (TPR) repeat protein